MHRLLPTHARTIDVCYVTYIYGTYTFNECRYPCDRVVYSSIIWICCTRVIEAVGWSPVHCQLKHATAAYASYSAISPGYVFAYSCKASSYISPA